MITCYYLIITDRDCALLKITYYYLKLVIILEITCVLLNITCLLLEITCVLLKVTYILLEFTCVLLRITYGLLEIIVFNLKLLCFT